jgi:hypothetical protein
MRANLSKAAWVGEEPVFKDGNDTLRYLHGHENSYFRNRWIPYDSTLGLCGHPGGEGFELAVTRDCQ